MKIQFTWQMALSTMAVGVFAAGCAGGASELKMNRSHPLQDAQAMIELSEESNGNTEVELEVSNLKVASDLRDDAETYVVWAQDHGGGSPQNLGALNVGSNGRGEMESITPFKKFDIFVTAEPIASAKTPSGDKALWASVSQE